MTSAKHKAALSVCRGSAAEAHSSWGFMVDLESEGKGQLRAQSPATQCWETKALEEVAAEASSSEVVLWKMVQGDKKQNQDPPWLPLTNAKIWSKIGATNIQAQRLQIT